ncbi:hypothetical protein VNI00_016282 [Paramarasmius palmivorus]|uniref:BTB domain-containing protein n=1 Tax=Paramarasmius palmivorus TaxID=297713 RepID=A0AAW0BDT4_9AGAR
MTTTIASPPFDAPSADVVLRTSDNIDFRVSRFILSLVSPFFRDMFTLPPPSQPTDEDQVVNVTEDGVTIDCTLRLIYPGQRQPPMKTWKEVSSVFRTLVKYQMEDTAAFDTVAQLLQGMSCRKPDDVDISAIPRHLKHPNWESYSIMRVVGTMQTFRDSFTDTVFEQAFQKTLEVPFHELATAYVQDLDGLTVRDFIKLLRRHRGPREPLKLEKSKMVEWYTSKLVPKFKIWEDMDTISLLPYEPVGWACNECGRKRCRSMLQAATAIFRTEVGLALSQGVSDELVEVEETDDEQ